MLGLGLSVTQLAVRGLRLTDLAAAIRALFAAGEQGVWYDPSDLTTLYQDAAGTTPVTAVEQPVGLILDKSKGLVLGPELKASGTAVTVGTATAANYNSASGEGSVTRVDVNNQSAVFFNGLTASGFHKVVVSNTGSVGLAIRNRTNGVALATIAAGSTATAYLLADATFNSLVFCASTAGTATFTVSSVRELPGNHATQTTSTSRPVLSGRYNLLTKTERFDDAAWGKAYVTVTANAITAPDGTLTADKLLETAVTNYHWIKTATLTYSAGTYTTSVYAKAAERSWLLLQPYDGGSTPINAYFDLVNGAVGSKTTGVTSSITSVGDGWYKCSMTYTFTTSYYVYQIITALSDGNISYAGDTSKGIYLWGADLRVANGGIGLPAYQRVNTATDYDADPAKFPHYLRFDGVDDSLVTNSISFTATDKMFVSAGVRKLSDSAVATVAELSANSGVTPNTFAVFAPGAVAPNYAFRSSGTSDSVATATTFASPITNVLVGLGEVASDTAILRIDGTQAASSTADQGTGNYGNYPLYIGRRGGTSLPFNGHLYSLIVRGAQSTDQQIIDAERYVNDKTRAY